MQGMILHISDYNRHALFKRFEHMYYHPNSVQNIITTQPSCMYSANNSVTYFRRLEDFEVYRKD